MNEIRCKVGKEIEINFCRAFNKIVPEKLSLPQVRTGCVHSKCQDRTKDVTGVPIDFIHLIPSLDIPEEEILTDKKIMIRCQCSSCRTVFSKSLFSFFNDYNEKKDYYDKHGLIMEQKNN